MISERGLATEINLGIILSLMGNLKMERCGKSLTRRRLFLDCRTGGKIIAVGLEVL